MSGAGDHEPRQGPLGTCPTCDVQIPQENLLIRYESTGDWPRLFAECPACGDPVHPQ